MKRIKILKSCILLLATALFVACDEKGGDGISIAISDSRALNQTVYANQTKGSNIVNFTASGAWTATIVGEPQTRTTDVATSEWIAVNPSKGDKAGNYSIGIALSPNFSGKDRKALISIVCNGLETGINLIQKGEDENGEKPDSSQQPVVHHSVTDAYTLTNMAMAMGIVITYKKNDEKCHYRKFELNRAVGRFKISTSDIIGEATNNYAVTYVEDLTRYVYRSGNDTSPMEKYREPLDEAYWAEVKPLELVGYSDGFLAPLSEYLWTKMGNQYTGTCSITANVAGYWAATASNLNAVRTVIMNDKGWIISDIEEVWLTGAGSLQTTSVECDFVYVDDIDPDLHASSFTKDEFPPR
jgi:hypothetical protein